MLYEVITVKNRRQAVSRAKELGLLDAAQSPQPSPRSNLPLPSTPFIGRRDEIESIKHHLRQTRLLTLSGPGGIGKTRLAIKAAEELAEDFQDGAFFVSLAPIHSVITSYSIHYTKLYERGTRWITATPCFLPPIDVV